MKQEKKFVRYTNFTDQNYNREHKKTNNRKSYTEKSTKHRESIKQIIQSFNPSEQISEEAERLIKEFPKFFNSEPKVLEKDHNEVLNDYLIFNARKFVDAGNQPKKQFDKESQDEPDWNSDEDVDMNMESKKIKEEVVEKIAQKYGDMPSKKVEILKRHEKEFLQDHYKKKRLQEQEEKSKEEQKITDKTSIPTSSSEKNLQASSIENKSKAQVKLTIEKPQSIWSEYQEKQINKYLNMGLIKKIDENEEYEEFMAQGAEEGENENFNFESSEDEEEKKGKTKEKGDSSSSDEDDIFGDEHPTTTKKTKPVETETSESNITQGKVGKVYVNNHMFTKIADKVGILGASCMWIISKDKIGKYRVTTEYMDQIYRKEKLYEMFPFISLNHSEFVHNQDVETEKGLEQFKHFNARRGQEEYRGKNTKYQYRYKKNYKEKSDAHLKKK